MSSLPAIEPRRPLRWASPSIFSALLLSACGYDSGSRWLTQGTSTPICTLDQLRCAPELERCVDGAQGAHWALSDDCSSRGLICSNTLEACVVCEPNRQSCSGQTIMQCDATGSQQSPLDTCDPSAQKVCREGSCVNLCSVASQRRSNVGCEYFAVDLDNAKINDTLNAAAQQFAVVISNPETDVAAEVTIEQDDSEPGQEK